MLLGLLCLPASAQLQPAIVNENRSARARIDAAVRQVEAGNTTAAFTAFEQLLGQKEDKLVRIAPNHYVTVRDVCHTAIGRLPAAARDAYQDRIDARASQWLARGKLDEPAQLQRVVDDALHSTAGAEAVYLRGQLAWEDGDPGLGYDYWRRLLGSPTEERKVDLRIHQSKYPPSAIAARLVLCRIASGDLPTAEAELRAFREQLPNATGTLGAESGSLTTMLRDALSSARQNQNDQSKRHSTWRVAWTRRIPLVHPKPDFSQTALKPIPLSARATATGDAIFVADNQSVFGMEPRNGLNLWTNKPDTKIFGDADDAPIGIDAQRFRSQPVAADGRLLVRLGSRATSQGSRVIDPNRSSSIACLGLKWSQGRTLWRVDAEDIAKSAVFESAPTVFGSRCFVVLRTSPPGNTLVLACLSLEDGTVQWQRELCSGIDQPTESGLLATSLRLVVSRSHVIVLTDNGLIIAMRHNGDFAWARSYARTAKASRYCGDRIRTENGFVFAAPYDSDSILAIRERTGELAWQRTLPDRIESIAAAKRGKVIVAGRSIWALSQSTGSVEWGGPGTSPEHFGNGTPICVADCVLFPTRKAIEIRDLSSGRALQRQLPIQGGGNLTAGNQAAVVVADDRVTMLKRE